MTKETKITTEKVVENIKDFIAELHEIAIDGIKTGVLTVKIENGEVKGIENITNPKIKEQLAKAVSKLSDKLSNK